MRDYDMLIYGTGWDSGNFLEFYTVDEKMGFCW